MVPQENVLKPALIFTQVRTIFAMSFLETEVSSLKDAGECTRSQALVRRIQKEDLLWLQGICFLESCEPLLQAMKDQKQSLQ